MAGFVLGSPESIHTIGIFLGWAILAGYLLLVMKFFARQGYYRYVVKINPAKPFAKNYMAFMQMIMAGHGYIGLYLVTIIILHAMIELTHRGLFISGIIALGLILLQIGLGIYGTFFRGRRKGPWLTAHRTVAALLAFAITYHIITVVILHRSSTA